jgi:hypothetical protein
MDKHESSVLDAMLHVVESQLRDNDPPETRLTLARLIQQGFSEKDAKKMLRCVAALEIQNIMEKKEPFNVPRYVEALKKLPVLPWEQ